MKVMPIETAPLISELTIAEGRGEGEYEVRLMKEADQSWITPERARDLWKKSSVHDVLFSDYTRGDPKAFLRALSKPNSIWFEVTKDSEPVGILYVHNLIPKFDAVGHFAFWDKIGRGREPLVLETISYLMLKYQLQRMSAEVPVYQKGTIRFIKRLGFEKEGERRNGVVYRGEWVNQLLFGLLRKDIINVEVEVGPDE